MVEYHYDMKLIERLRQSVAKRHGNIILRREVANLGSASRISEALLTLQQEGVLTRLGSGVYAKAEGRVDTDWVSLIKEAYGKFGLDVGSTSVTPKKIEVQLIGECRTVPSLEVAGHVVRIVSYSRKLLVPENVDELPTQGVADYVLRLARTHHIKYRRSAVEQWAEAVTRAAGDDAKTDKTRGLLIRLKQRKVLNADQFIRLIVNHRREQAVV